MSSVFNQGWLEEIINPQFSYRVKPLKDPNRVLCCFCQQSFALSNMVKRALKSPMNGDKQKIRVCKGTKHKLVFQKTDCSVKNLCFQLC